MKKRYWFRAKYYGYGWYPATWEAWLVMLGWLIIFVAAMVKVDHEAFKNFLLIFIDTALLIYICYKTGEKARWRWGKK